MSRDWVVELDGGLREAERLAAQTETDLLGEVIPGSGLFQLRERSSRVRREAAAGISVVACSVYRALVFRHDI